MADETGIGVVPPSKPKDDTLHPSSVTIEVEGTLYRIPRRPFEVESDRFKRKTRSSPECRCDEALVLYGIAANSFRTFLSVLLHRGDISEICLSREEWSSVLHFSKMLECNRIFDIAISKLSALVTDPVKRVVLARLYNIESWLRPALFDLATRSRPLSGQEASELGMDYVVKLNKVREQRYNWIINNADTDWMRLPLARERSYWRPAHSWVQEVRRSQLKNDRRLGAAVHASLTRTFDLD